MDLAELSRELERQSMLAAGTFSKVVILAPMSGHFEIESITVLGDTLILNAGDEAEAPHDPADARALEEVEEQERDYAADDSAHLRMAEDQPAQERTWDETHDPEVDL